MRHRSLSEHCWRNSLRGLLEGDVRECTGCRSLHRVPAWHVSKLTCQCQCPVSGTLLRCSLHQLSKLLLMLMKTRIRACLSRKRCQAVWHAWIVKWQRMIATSPPQCERASRFFRAVALPARLVPRFTTMHLLAHLASNVQLAVRGELKLLVGLPCRLHRLDQDPRHPAICVDTCVGPGFGVGTANHSRICLMPAVCQLLLI